MSLSCARNRPKSTSSSCSRQSSRKSYLVRILISHSCVSNVYSNVTVWFCSQCTLTWAMGAIMLFVSSFCPRYTNIFSCLSGWIWSSELQGMVVIDKFCIHLKTRIITNIKIPYSRNLERHAKYINVKHQLSYYESKWAIKFIDIDWYSRVIYNI